MPRLENDQHEHFAREYMRLNHVTKAALSAGYSERSAAQQGSRLLKNVKVQARLEELRAKQAARLDISDDKIMRHLAAVAFGSPADFVRFTDDGEPMIDFTLASREQLAALSKLEVHDYTEGRGENSRDVRKITFTMHPKLPALVKLAEKRGLLKDDGEKAGDAASAWAQAIGEVLAKPSPMPIPTLDPDYQQPDE